MDYETEKAVENVKTFFILLGFLGFLWLSSWLVEDDRQAVVLEACCHNPNMEVCSTLTKEK